MGEDICDGLGEKAIRRAFSEEVHDVVVARGTDECGELAQC